MTDTKLTIGWIGAGKMGLPICMRFKAAGHAVQVLARSAESNTKLESAGLSAKSSIKDVCSSADIVFSSISDDAALQEVVCGAGGVADTLAKGGTYIDISTVSPEASRKVAQRLQQAGIAYLRSPVSGSTVMAEAGTLTAVVSGLLSKFVELQSVFAQFSRKSFHVGEAEEARAMKLVLNSMVAATSALLAEALAFGAKGGLDIATMLNVVNQSVVASPLIAYKTDMMVKGDYTPAATLSMLKKDVELFLTTGANEKLKLPLASTVHAIYQKAAHDGLGEQDFFVLIQDALKHSG
jgi:3-hydroxyisobutyrate dehydrogenase-like beta-hydroxyacid dehydrogenase